MPPVISDTERKPNEKNNSDLAYAPDMTYKLYDSHHYQYIPEMLTEYLKMTYPPQN